MSAPRGNREFRSSRGQPPPAPRGGRGTGQKPTILKRSPGNEGEPAGSNLLQPDGASSDSLGAAMPDGPPGGSIHQPQYGMPPTASTLSGSALSDGQLQPGRPTGYGAPPSFSSLAYAPAPSVQGAPIQGNQQMHPLQSPQPLLPEQDTAAILQQQELLLHRLQQQLQQQQSSSSAPPPPSLLHFPALSTLQMGYVSSPFNVQHAPPSSMDAAQQQYLQQMQQLQLHPQFVHPNVSTMPGMSGVPQSLLDQYPMGIPGLSAEQLLYMQRQTQQYTNQIRAQHKIMMSEPKEVVDSLSRISPKLKRLTTYTPQKKLFALVETDDNSVINRAFAELRADFDKYDGRSTVPISKCSMEYLNARGIEFLPIPHSQFPWAPYYCTLCDYHIQDLFAASENHLPTHMKEERRLSERRQLPDRLPPLAPSQLAAIEKVLVEAAVSECRPERETKLRSVADAVIESIKALCKATELDETQEVHVALHGSLVSGLLRDDSDINVSLSVDGKNPKYFVDDVLPAIAKTSEWSEARLCEAPTGQPRIQAVFNGEKVTVDWQNGEGVKLSQLLSLYNRLHEDVAALRQIVRSWGERCDLTTAEKLSSQHAVPPVLLDVMLLHALQQLRVLPCIHEIRKRSGKDVVDEDISDILAEQLPRPIRWNFAEMFLQFLLYYSKGDVKHYLIQITSLDRGSKADTKINKKHLAVMDPVRGDNKQIAPLHKAFQCYFLNCFLTTYVHFRIPRTKAGDGVEPKALVSCEVFQTASTSPLKKKTNKSGSRRDDGGEQKGEERDEIVTPGSSAFPTPRSDARRRDTEPLDSPTADNVPMPTGLLNQSIDSEDYYTAEDSTPESPANFLDKLLAKSLKTRRAPPQKKKKKTSLPPPSPAPVDPFCRYINVTYVRRPKLVDVDDAVIDEILEETASDFLVFCAAGEEEEKRQEEARHKQTRLAHIIRIGYPRGQMAATLVMRAASLRTPFNWRLIRRAKSGAGLLVVDLEIANGHTPMPLRFLIGSEQEEGMGRRRLEEEMDNKDNVVAIGWFEPSLLNESTALEGSEGANILCKGVSIVQRQLVQSIKPEHAPQVWMTLCIGQNIVIHGKQLEEMRPEDFEIEGDKIYSRRSMMDMKNLECEIGKELWSAIVDAGLNLYFPMPDESDEDENAPVPRPHVTPRSTAAATPRATPSSTTPAKKKRNKKKTKGGKKEEGGTQEETGEDSQEGGEHELTIGQCASVALDVVASEEASTSSAAPQPAAQPAAVEKQPKARRALKLIKVDSAESSDLSCADPSPPVEKDLSELVADLTIQPTPAAPSSTTPKVVPSATAGTTVPEETPILTPSPVKKPEPVPSGKAGSSKKSTVPEETPILTPSPVKKPEPVPSGKAGSSKKSAVPARDTVPEETPILTPSPVKKPVSVPSGTAESSTKGTVASAPKAVRRVLAEMPSLTLSPVKKQELQEEEEKDSEESDKVEEEIVLPESSEPGLQATFEELYIDLKDFDFQEVRQELEQLSEEDFEYSFDSKTLTAGFKCDQHCSACDSPKHLVADCPQLKVPPVREISREHWRPHFSAELDRVICMIFDSEKISDRRKKDLNFVKTELNNAIQKKLKANGFRLDAFGSSENGFGSYRSDFDVCFRFGEEFDVNEKRAEMQIETIQTIEQALRNARFYKVMAITSAKVPIVKFSIRVESGAEIEGDISYYNELALHNTRLLKRYCSWTKDETLSKLGMFIKRWAKQCDIGDASKGSLSSYAYIILLIHFLQRLQPHPLLPVLQEMGDVKEILVDGWDVYFCDDAPKLDWSKCDLSVGELFLQFLEYFAKFDWHNQVVQIRQTNKLSKIERGWRKLMCIEDPFDREHNLASGISNRMFAFIMKSFVCSREVFFSLNVRKTFVKQFGVREDAEGMDIPISDGFIQRYGIALLQKCFTAIGNAPRDRMCFKCGRIGHFSDACPQPNSGYGRRGGPSGGGGGWNGGSGRGGGGAAGGGGGQQLAYRGNGRGGYRGNGGNGGYSSRTAEYANDRFREEKKQRLALSRAAFDATAAAKKK